MRGRILKQSFPSSRVDGKNGAAPTATNDEIPAVPSGASGGHHKLDVLVATPHTELLFTAPRRNCEGQRICQKKKDCLLFIPGRARGKLPAPWVRRFAPSGKACAC